MLVNNFKSKVRKLQGALEGASKRNVDFTKAPDRGKDIYSFREKRLSYYKDAVENSIKELKKAVWELAPLYKSNETQIIKLVDLMNRLNPSNPSVISRMLKEMLEISSDIHETPQKKISHLSIKPPSVPATIKSEIVADLEELERCFNSGCYRSATILCGRILETALHRKYYEVTKHDILEKNPGIGLGKLIAKLKEKNVELDPGLTQQIHLINQARIFSVHKKQEAFYPSREQAHAMILYTTDVLAKLFA